jgi:hypothetical protein
MAASTTVAPRWSCFAKRSRAPQRAAKGRAVAVVQTGASRAPTLVWRQRRRDRALAKRVARRLRPRARATVPSCRGCAREAAPRPRPSRAPPREPHRERTRPHVGRRPSLPRLARRQNASSWRKRQAENERDSLRLWANAWADAHSRRQLKHSARRHGTPRLQSWSGRVPAVSAAISRSAGLTVAARGPERQTVRIGRQTAPSRCARCIRPDSSNLEIE